MTSVDSIPAFLLAGVPVMQPPHLEGDPSLATEILPGPPPLLSVQQNGLPRKDHKKITTAFSYLPVSDPGTTYGVHMANSLTATSTTEADGPRRKRARLDKGSSSSRAQRASARQLAAPSASISQEGLASSSHIPDSDPTPVLMDDDDIMMISRSNSVPNVDFVPISEMVQNGDEDGSASAPKRPRRDKGKEKDKDVGFRVKEEQGAISLNLHDSTLAVSNEDHCSSCRSFGSLVYCDGCPRAFHPICLNPPIENNELQGDGEWYCPACTLRKEPPSKSPASFKFMAPLFDQLQSLIPSEFQLPTDIRTFFKDVSVSNRGGYVDSSEIKPPRLNRHGQLEDRDPYRLKDRNGDPVLCFKCGTSALSPGSSTSVPAMKRPRRASSRLSSTLSDTGKSIISCDYCHLHWHLDCVDPPLATMPPWSKKWMCPNHADQILKPKKRIPRAAPPIDITKSGEFNNGNIEIIQPEASVTAPPSKMTIEEVLINGRRYRVPEKIITMDFWNKTRRREHVRREDDRSSAMSSPLTSLSSLEDAEEVMPSAPQSGVFNAKEMKAALFLLGIKSQNSSAQKPNGVIHAVGNSKTDASSSITAPPVRIKEEPDLHVNGLLRKAESSTSKRASRASARVVRNVASTAAKGTRSSARVRAAQQVALKDDLGTEQDQTNQSASAAMPSPPQPKSVQKPPPHGIIAGDSTSVSAGTSASAIATKPKRTRRKQSPVPATKVPSVNGSDALQPNGSSSSLSTLELSTRSEAAAPSNSTDAAKKHVPSSYKSRSHAKPITPFPSLDKPAMFTPIGTPVAIGSLKPAANSTTPSLKIRLPRLSSISSPNLGSSSSAAAGDREAGKTSTASRPRPTRTRRLFDRPTSTSTSNEGHTSGTDATMLPPV